MFVNFDVGKDVFRHALVTYAAAANAAELLGRYGSAFAEPPSTLASDARAFDAWTALGSNAVILGSDFHQDGTRAARATSGASAPAQTARSVTGLGLGLRRMAVDLSFGR